MIIIDLWMIIVVRYYRGIYDVYKYGKLLLENGSQIAIVCKMFIFVCLLVGLCFACNFVAFALG